MSNGKFLTILVLITVVFGAIAGYYFFLVDETSPPDPPDNPDFPAFPPNTGPGSSTSTPPVIDPGQNTSRAPKLWQISSDPVAGASVYSVKNDPVFRYVERALGRVIEANPETGGKTVILSTVPQIHEAIWADKDAIVLRYLKGETVENFAVNIVRNINAISTSTSLLNPETDEVGLDGTFLPNRLETISNIPPGNNLFWIITGEDGATGFVSKADGTSRKKIWYSRAQQWNAYPSGKNLVSLNTKPSSYAPGLAYVLNTSTGGLIKIAGDLNGLTAIASPDGKKAIVSYIDKNILTTKIYILNQQITESVNLPFTTFADKCVWSNLKTTLIYCAVPLSFPRGNLPDAWCLGEYSPNDKIISYDLETEEVDGLSWLEEAKELDFDILSPQLNTSEEYIIFINKKDLSLWSFRIYDNNSPTSTDL